MIVNQIPKVKICGNTTTEDAIMAAYAGADAIGVINVANTKRYIDLETAKQIFQALPIFISKVVVVALDTMPVDAAYDQIQSIERIGADCIQLHGEESIELVTELRKRTNSRIRLIKKVGVSTDERECLENALAYEPVVDAILLDTVVVGGTGETGGTGKEHDWRISKQIVARLKTPVILAGGLNPDTVAGAIAQVKPFAVDVSSGVEREIRRKDEFKVKRFVAAAKSVKTSSRI